VSAPLAGFDARARIGSRNSAACPSQKRNFGRQCPRDPAEIDSVAEEEGFELPVPLRWSVFPNRLFHRSWRQNRVETDGLNPRGTDGSNPSSSRGESTNHRFRRRFHGLEITKEKQWVSEAPIPAIRVTMIRRRKSTLKRPS
jgi:hypothetical protein